MKIFTTLLTTTIAVLSLTACKSLPSYTSDYSQADQNIKGITFNDEQAQQIGSRFIDAFNALGTANFVAQASSLYADQLYINDTLSQFSNKQDLIKHFDGMNNRVSNVNVKLISATYHEDSAYIHWYMAYDFKMFGRTKSMTSYGISEVKINQNQQIIFQQDYWDPANGLYRSLPVFGGAYKWVLPFKKP
jgi:hypothetical protein